MRVKGSITIFMALAFFILIGIFVSIIERARVNSAKSEVELAAYSAQRSIAGYYHNELWAKYDILGLDMSKDRQKLFEEYIKDNTKNNNLFNINYKDINILPNYINENGGSELIRQATECMKYRIPSKLLEKIKGGDQKKEDAINIDDDITEDDVKNTKKIEITDPRDSVENIKDDDGFMNFIFGGNYSNKIISKKANIEGEIDKVSIYNSILFNEYVLSHFTSIVNSKNSKNKLDYEVEYILKGDNNDKVNIKKVLRDIKLIRLPINIAFLVNDTIYNNAAKIAAIIISGLTFNLSAIKATKMAIITAWAYAETAIDVKGLIEGKKVPLVKNRDTWHLGFDNIINFWNVKPKDNKKGMSYDDYLRGFLLIKSSSIKVRRSMDLIESNLNIDFRKIAYKYITSFNYSINKKIMYPDLINNNIYNNSFVAAYGYK